MLQDSINEITETGDHGETDVNRKVLLKKLTTVMSDRCSVMKCANKLLNEWRKNELTIDENQNEIEDIEFLYCSAHVLLEIFFKNRSKIEIET